MVATTVGRVPPRPTASTPQTWEEYAKALGAAIKARRNEVGLQQDRLAEMAGIARYHYQQIEHGIYRLDGPANPTIKVLARLAQALECEVADLLPSVTALTWD